MYIISPTFFLFFMIIYFTYTQVRDINKIINNIKKMVQSCFGHSVLLPQLPVWNGNVFPVPL